MRRDRGTVFRLLPLLLIGGLAVACDSPTDSGGEPNPDLVDEVNGAGFGSSADGLPQGSGGFSGPGGLPMEATAEEFIQTVTFPDGRTLRTSGVGIYAVPDGTVAAPVFDRIHFGAAATGSTESVEEGTYQIATPPSFDFIQVVEFAHAQVRPTGEGGRVYATEGEITISSLKYFSDTYTCELGGTALETHLCEYRLGLVTGVIEFTATLEDGTEVVQETTGFSLPIRRRTIVATYLGQ